MPLKTTTKEVMVSRTTATCEVCGRTAVVAQKVRKNLQPHTADDEYLEAVRDPLCPEKEPTTASFAYGCRELYFSLTVVFVEIPDALGTYDKQDRLVCSKCYNEHSNPLVIPAKNAVLPCASVDPGEETQKLPPRIKKDCSTCRFDDESDVCGSCHGYSAWKNKVSKAKS